MQRVDVRDFNAYCRFPVGMTGQIRNHWANLLADIAGRLRYRHQSACHRRVSKTWMGIQFMAGFGHGGSHPVEQEDPRVVGRNARHGMRLFLIYLAFYAGFVGLNAFAPRQMEVSPAFGVNLAILYGCGLIVLAMVLALIYCWQCRGDQALPGEKM